MDIKVGDYFRDDEGNILCVDHINADFEDNDHRKVMLSQNESLYWSSTLDLSRLKSGKHSYDLIEYGDIIKFRLNYHNKIKVIDTRVNQEKDIMFLDADFCNGWLNMNGEPYMIYGLDFLIKKSELIKTEWILTHEKIEKECYIMEGGK